MKNVIDWEVLLCCWTIRQVNAESYERASFCVHCGLQSGLKGKEHTHKWGGVGGIIIFMVVVVLRQEGARGCLVYW